MYDYGARFYDPSIAQWNSIDPLASDPDNISFSPYAYVWNNPLRFNDPTGMKGDTLRYSGTPEFIEQAKSDINAIRNSTPEGNQLVSFLDDHEMDTEISEASSVFGYLKNLVSEGSGDINHLTSSGTDMGLTMSEGRPLGVRVRYSTIDGVQLDGTDSKSVEVLFHELVHAKQLISYEPSCLRACGMKPAEVRGALEAEAVQSTNIFRMKTGRGGAFRQFYIGTRVVTPNNQTIKGVKIY